MAWIRIEQSLPQNRKFFRLKTVLRIDTAKAIGTLALLWIWAIDNADGGALGGISDVQLAEICQFNQRRASELRSALIESGFLELRNDDLIIHDWDEFGGRLDKQRKYYREYRRKQRQAEDDASLCSTEVQHIDKIRQDKIRQDEIKNIFSGDDGGVCAGANEADEYLLGRGLVPESWFGQDEGLSPKVRRFADSIFEGIWGREPGPTDYGRVFQCVVEIDEEGGRQHCRFSDNRAELLMYAFESAAGAGSTGRWDYVYGVLRRLAQRGIRSLGDAEEYDLTKE